MRTPPGGAAPAGVSAEETAAAGNTLGGTWLTMESTSASQLLAVSPSPKQSGIIPPGETGDQHQHAPLGKFTANHQAGRD